MLQCGFFDLDNRYQKLDERDPLISLKGPSKNALLPRLRRQRRAPILRYHLYTAVARAVLPCTHEKITIFSRCP